MEDLELIVERLLERVEALEERVDELTYGVDVQDDLIDELYDEDDIFPDGYKGN